MKIVEEPKLGDIPVTDMTDGQIAVVTQWTDDAYIGEIVQRFGLYLLQIGGGINEGWGEFFLISRNRPDCRVRILPKGTKLEI